MEFTSYKPGTFSWVDLATSDQNAAKDFYAEIMGWSYIDNPMGDDTFYTMAQTDGKDAAGIFTLHGEQAKMGIPPHWQSYITVENADAAAEKAKGRGANILMEPFDVFTSGRMAAIQDPGGAVFNVWDPKDSIGAGIANCPGSFCWNELMTKDVEGSKAFYTGMFEDWTAETADMGEFEYTSFMRDGRGMDGMMEISPDMGDMPPNWGVYLAVEDCDATLEKVASLGGQQMMPAQEVPEIGRFATVTDPQGAAFTLITLHNPE